jgi:SEC-C motif-containing protein
MKKACPCQSSLSYKVCCGLFHRGQQVPLTAEALMRSRYSAYVLNKNAYLYESWHSHTRPVRKEVNKSPPSEWLGLNILRVEDGAEDDDLGVVEFVATYVAKDQIKQLYEVSRFCLENGQWRYVEAVRHGNTCLTI